MAAVRAVYATLIAMFVLAGCGGSNVSGPVSGARPAAELKPGAAVYVETASDQWQQAEELLRRFPDGEQWIRDLRRKVAKHGVDWEDDVVPALGETTAVAVYRTKEASDTVLLTNPEDPKPAVALFERLDDLEGTSAIATRVVGEWVVASSSRATIDARVKASGGDSLADDRDFEAAMNSLPADALARAYADPAAAKSQWLDRLDFAGAGVKAADSGADVILVGGGEAVGTTEPYSSALLARVPGDAIAFVSFQAESAKSPFFSRALRQLERKLRMELEELVAIADGEVAVYARPGLPIPELTLLLEAANVEQARSSAEAFVRALAREEGGEVTEDGDVTTAVIDGFPLNLATVDDLVVLTTSKRGLADLAESGDKLPDSGRYKAAVDEAGAPDAYTGLAYVDLADALFLLQAYFLVTGESERVSPELTRNLGPLESLVAWGTVDGDVASTRAFLGID